MYGADGVEYSEVAENKLQVPINITVFVDMHHHHYFVT